MNTPLIQTASLGWNAQGTPVSQQFDDVYFSNQDGLEETRHVFLRGNGFPERFHHHPRALCVVAETGFGTGLNFLTLWQAFEQFQRQYPAAPLQRLHFISCEKFPLLPDDLAAAHQRWPELASYAEQLRQQWPLPLAGCHRLLLAEGSITLDLWFGDVNHLLNEFDVSMNERIDAWFLDGFAPAKNPEMWSDALFHKMVQLARSGGTFATFTAAGFVRRGLQQAGFQVVKTKGFGQKREMLTGSKRQSEALPSSTPWYGRPAAQMPEEVAIIGGGIAGALTALALQRRGARVTLYCADEQGAQGASGNRQGALYPLLNGSGDALERFFVSAFTFARRSYDSASAQGLDFAHQWCGVSQLGYDEKSRHKLAKITTPAWPESLVRAADRRELSAMCGLDSGHGGVHYPLGGWLCPAELTRALIEQAQRAGMRVYYQHQLIALEHREQEWQLSFSSGASARHATLVLANGHQISQWPPTQKLPVSAARGQVSHIPTTSLLRQLRQVLCYDGYLTPHDPANLQHCIGASYRRGEIDTDYRHQDQLENRARLLRCLPDCDWPSEVSVERRQARCGVRCVTRDHLPLVGALPDYEATLAVYGNSGQRSPAAEAPVYPNLFIIAALGSRGLCSAPLAAEVLAAQIFAEPLPLDRHTLAAINPNRFWIRKLLKGRPVTRNKRATGAE